MDAALSFDCLCLMKRKKKRKTSPKKGDNKLKKKNNKLGGNRKVYKYKVHTRIKMDTSSREDQCTPEGHSSTQRATLRMVKRMRQASSLQVCTLCTPSSEHGRHDR